MDEVKKCERCGKKSEDVKDTLDPFQLEVWDKQEEITVCDDCYKELADEV